MYKKIAAICVQVIVFAFYATPLNVFASASDFQLNAAWSEVGCVGTIDGTSGITSQAVPQGNDVSITVHNTSAVSLRVLFVFSDTADIERILAPGASDTESHTNLKGTMQISPLPATTACSSTNVARHIVYAQAQSQSTEAPVEFPAGPATTNNTSLYDKRITEYIPSGVPLPALDASGSARADVKAGGIAAKSDIRLANTEPITALKILILFMACAVLIVISVFEYQKYRKRRLVQLAKQKKRIQRKSQRTKRKT